MSTGPRGVFRRVLLRLIPFETAYVRARGPTLPRSSAVSFNYAVQPNGNVRPVYLTVVDITEFAVDKLANRGTSQGSAIVTNVQDFMIHLRENLINGRGA